VRTSGSAVRTVSPLLAATGGAPVLPLVVLFLFNLVDEFDRVAFGVLSPEIRDTFHLSDSGIVAIGSIAGVTSLVAALPIGVLADRLTRVRMAAVGAGVWGAFTIVTALSPVTWVLALARTFAGVGRIVNEPVHASLLTDYYRPVHHPRVFALHRLANPIGLSSALLIGLLGAWFDWRLVFAFLCVPTFLLLPVLLRLREPARGESVDAAAAQAAAGGVHVSFGEARRQLFAIRTLRRLWLALPVLGIAILVLTQLTSLFFEREYGYGPTGRGLVTFLSGVGIVIGLGLGQRVATRALSSGCPERLATDNGLAVAGVGLGIAGMVLSPWPELSAAMNLLTGIGIGAYQPCYFSLVALVSPARIRAQAYAYAILFLGGGGLLAPTFASLGENSGYRLSLGLLAGTIFAGGLVIMTATGTVRADAERATAALTDRLPGDEGDGPELAAPARPTEPARAVAATPTATSKPVGPATRARKAAPAAVKRPNRSTEVER
jgi:MFS family permease